MSPEEKSEKKQAYEKPRLRIIELAAEEVLGIGCKMSEEHYGALGARCTVNNCVQIKIS